MTTAPAKTTEPHRFRELDSLRGLAALSVVIAHFLHIFPETGRYAYVHQVETALRQTPLFAAFAGNEAVILFFLLSGFVLSLPTLEGRPVGYAGYALRRFFRIYVPYFFAVVTSITLAVLCFTGRLPELSEWANRPWSTPTTLRSVIDHLLLIGSFNNSQFNPVFWSLVHEMRISLIFPFVVLALWRCNWKAVCLAALSASAAGVTLNKFTGGVTDCFLSLHYLGIFILGFLLARHRSAMREWFRGQTTALKAGWLVSGIVAYAYGRYAGLNVLHDWATAAGAAIFIVVSLSSERASLILNWKPVRFLGETSYSLYLYHAALLLAGLHLFHAKVPVEIILVAVLLLSLAVAGASYRWIELPAIRAGKKLATKLNPSLKHEPAGTVPFSDAAAPASTTAPLVSIQIVTWNRRHELTRCLKSVLAQSYGNFEIVVVDNASTDGTAEMLAAEFPRVRLVQSEKNLGCPSGRNLGFAHCEGKYIYMLDDDGWLESDAVEVAVRRAESDERIGAVMSRIHEWENGRVVRRRPVDLDTSVYLAEFSGGCSLIRRSVLAAAGMFPEDFFRQAEESDLALRMLDAGFFCFLEPTSVMYHAPSPAGRNSKAAIFYTLRNTNRTGLRLWPFPWCFARPVLNLFHAVRFSISMRYFTLPAEVLGTLVHDLRQLPGQRKPVTRRAYSLFRRLQKQPSCCRPA